MLIKTCDFCDICMALILCDQIIWGIQNSQIQAGLREIRVRIAEVHCPTVLSFKTETTAQSCYKDTKDSVEKSKSQKRMLVLYFLP